MNYTTKSFELSELLQLTPKTQNELKAKLINESKICQLCQNEIQKPVLDHQHMTSKETIGQNGAGLVRGVICNNCNQVLGKIETNSKRFGVQNLPEFLKNTAKYLEQDNLPYIHSSETKRLKIFVKKSEYNRAIRRVAKAKGKTPLEISKKYKFSKYLTKPLEILFEISKNLENF